LALSHDGGKVAAAGQRGVAVWDLGAHLLLEELGAAGAQPLSEVPNAVRASSSAAFSPDGRLLAWSVLPTMEPDGRVVVWDLVRGREVLRFPSLVAVGFSPGGQRVAGQSTEEDFTVVDLRTRERKRVPELPWKAERREPGSSLPGRLWSVESGASGLGASIAFDGTLTLWDVARRQPLGTLPVPGAFDFSDLVFDPTGQRLAVATAGGAMSVVQVTPDAWRAHACTLVARDLTGEERRLHLGGRDLPRPCP
jgi:WD40 repeat protein